VPVTGIHCGQQKHRLYYAKASGDAVVAYRSLDHRAENTLASLQIYLNQRRQKSLTTLRADFLEIDNDEDDNNYDDKYKHNDTRFMANPNKLCPVIRSTVIRCLCYNG